ncbi:MerR family transcriptional regulator [Gordonia sp. OPL2]|uniref:MerR family transcriptional regulator n=1 Tax=Gordonia sp. OPL2 TaxID=2486274 RepID=UPI0016556626|nr:MerR family transcriptional regulator [Gordonia sp. OPL2]RPA10192.1 MerR family transcriptional regulator [Gordonia sp. OPL2]
MSDSDTSKGGGHLQIGEVAARTELSIKTIRHYDEVGLVVPSARSAGGFRLYTTDDVARLLTIRRMKPVGFSLDDMRELLDAQDVLDAPGTSDEERTAASSRLADFHQRAEQACARLSRHLDYARELTDALSVYSDTDSGHTGRFGSREQSTGVEK